MDADFCSAVRVFLVCEFLDSIATFLKQKATSLLQFFWAVLFTLEQNIDNYYIFQMAFSNF